MPLSSLSCVESGHTGCFVAIAVAAIAAIAVIVAVSVAVGW
jgi:hypothetical protein